MSDIQLYLLEVDKNKSEAKNIAGQSALKLERKQLKLIDLITSLEQYINSKDDGSLRAKSMAYLADVLESVPPRTLSGQERRLLCDFILGRIEGDVEGIGSSAKALLALEERGKWDAETAQRVTKSFLEHANPLKEFKLQTERLAIIQLFDRLMAKYRTALQQMHDSDAEFIPKLIACFDGEKDPRNLMIIFSIFYVPMVEWNVHAYGQDLFEAVFNYFPITFKPPADDPYGITAQDLKDRLRDCIAANSDFAPFAFPALLDKLDSTSMNTKRDVLHTIQACINGYGVQTINMYSASMWDALKFEILNVQEEDLAEESLKALSAIGRKFVEAEGPLNSYLRPVIKECNEHMEDAPTKQSQAAGRILHSVAAGAVPVADKITKGVLPTLLTLYSASESITKRRGLLEAFNEISKAYKELEASQVKVNVETLQAFSSDAWDVMLRALTNAPKVEVSFRLTALRGIVLLLSIRNLLSQDQACQGVEAVTNIILHEEVYGHGDIRTEARRALTEMAHSSPEAIRDKAIPAFMVELPDVPEDGSQFEPVLEAFAQLSSELQVFDTIVLRLKNKLNTARTQNASQEYQHAILLAMLYAFTHGTARRDEEGVLQSSYFTDYAEPLIDNLQKTSITEMDPKMMEITGRICNVILRRQGFHFQSTVYNENLDWMSPAQRTTSIPHDRVSLLTPFSLYYYAALRPEVVHPEDIVVLLKACANSVSSSSSSNHSARDSTTVQQISLIINKFIDPKLMHSTLLSVKLEVESLMSTEPHSSSTVVVFAVVKALLVQGKSAALTSKYLQLLLHHLPSIEKSEARRFASLLAPNDILTKGNHCLVSGLYKQKTFNQMVPPIVEAVRTASASAKPNYLIALSGILRWLPYSMIESSLPSLMAPLLQTLDLNDPADHEIEASTLTIFESVLMHDPNVVSEHAASLITRLLNSTTGSGHTTKVRAKALQCLALIPRQLKRAVVVPFRRQVVKKLMACLDDPKRDVRAEAVRCRTAWLALDDGDEEED